MTRMVRAFASVCCAALRMTPSRPGGFWPRQGTPTGFSVETWQTSSATWLRRNEAIQAMLRQVDIDVRIVQVD